MGRLGKTLRVGAFVVGVVGCTPPSSMRPSVASSPPTAQEMPAPTATPSSLASSGTPSPLAPSATPSPPAAAADTQGASRGGAANPPAAARTPLYSVDEAVRDALSGPLELVGMGGWHGYSYFLTCVYRNARVFVVDVRCKRHETYQFELVVDSPSRGRASVVVESPSGTVVSGVDRRSYVSFALGLVPPWDGAPPLSLGMSFDELSAYEKARDAKYPAGCSMSNSLPAGYCGRGSIIALSDFLAANSGFFQAPPDFWSTLVRALAAERPKSYATTTLSKLTAEQLGSWGATLGHDTGIDVTAAALELVGNRESRFAAVVALDDGGIAYVGTRRSSAGDVPVVARTDRAGVNRWEKTLTERGWHDTDVTRMIATRDGFIVHIQAYTIPGRAHHRLVKLGEGGRVLWTWFAPDQGTHGIPQVSGAQLTERGTVGVTGYIQLERDGDVLGWSAEVSAEGKTLSTAVGAVQQKMAPRPFK